ncbi:MAG: isoprenylcysteine carboxylmethyltransferase family protein [Chloroflexi bacterium]|nr:isoprenylcysteine carboxylmethyltransferase family protein [Chloroflexota bacterium]
MDIKQLARTACTRFFSAIPALGLIFFLPAGTFDYWQAWLYMALLFTPMFFLMRYLIKNDPALLERRMKMKEKAAEQSLIIKLSYMYFLATFLLPGFDRRFGWSNVPLWLVLFADALVLAGYILVMLVFKENSYAARTVEVEEGQKVIDTGPYAVVRHPMYVGVGLLYVLTPPALGSAWAMIPAIFLIPLLIARIVSEERILAKELKGYTEYQQKVRYRLLPGVW